MSLVNPYSLLKEVYDQHKNGTPPFYSVGFKAVDAVYRVGLGHTTYITGIPSDGKSTMLFEWLLNLSERESFTHTIFTPETGDPTRIAIELLQMRLSKHFDKKWDYNRIEEKEIAFHLEWIGQHFNFISDGSYTVEEILDFDKRYIEEQERIAKQNDKEPNKKHTLTIDPWNELSHDFTQFGAREDKYLENKLGLVRRYARKENIHVFLIAHPKGLFKEKITFNGQTLQFYNPPTAYDLSGGAAWFAKGETILCVYRPPAHISNEDNEVWVEVHKAKPREAGNKGRAILYYLWDKYRYVERDAAHDPHFAFEYEKFQKGIQETLRDKAEQQRLKDEQDAPF